MEPGPLRGEQEIDTLESPTFITHPPPYKKTDPEEAQSQDDEDTSGPTLE